MKIIGTKEEIEQLNEIFRDARLNNNCYTKECDDCMLNCRELGLSLPYNKDKIEIEVINDEIH